MEEIERKFWLPEGVPVILQEADLSGELIVQRYLELHEQEQTAELSDLGLPEEALSIIFGLVSGEVRHRYSINLAALGTLPALDNFPVSGSRQGLPEHPERGRRDTLTVKSGSGRIREEWEVEISIVQAEWLRNFSVDLPVSKLRRRYPLGGLTAEVDQYQAQLLPLVTVEVEFPSEAAAERFVLPEIFGVAIDVSEDPSFKNRSLAANGVPDAARRLRTS